MSAAASPIRSNPNPVTLRQGNLPLRIWGITVIALLAICGALAWTSYDEYEKTQAQEYRFLETHARFGEARIAEALHRVDLLLQDVIDAKLSAPDLQADFLQRRQLNQLRQFPEIHYLITTDDKGQVATAESVDDPVGVIDVRKFNASQRDYFAVHRDAKREDFYRNQISRPFKTITNRHTITISRAIRGKTGQFEGVALVSLSPAYFDSVLQQVLANEVVDAAAMHNRLGDIIYRRPDPDMHVGKNIAGGDAFKLYLRSDQHLTRYLGVTATDNVKRMLVFSKVGDTGLDIGVSAQFDVVMAQWRSNVLMKVLIFVIVAGLSVALARGSQRRLLERARNEEVLRESELRFRTLLQSIPSVAVQGYAQDGTTRYWNAASESLYGYSADEAIGSNLVDLIIPPEMRAGVRAAMREMFETGRPIPAGELFLMRKDGSKVNVFSSHALVKGQVPEMFCVNVDLTERKLAEETRLRLEAQLRESQKMEALGTLAGGVAHDFNNALAMIAGNVELARQDVGPGHTALVSLEEIDKASRRAKDLVQQILAFGRRQKLERKVMSLALVVVETARLVRATLPAMVSLSVDCKGDTPAVLADATAVKQILLNLCANASQAVRDQKRPGVIEVRLEACTQGEARGSLRPGRYACLTVRDNGPGMDEAIRAHIFEPFFTTKQAGEGTGLGLSVVHGMVQAHEASMEVESTPGVGSAFRIYFPAVEAPVAEVLAPGPDAAPVQGRGKHVLYLDDEEAIIFLMQRLLQRKGYRVTGYTEPRKALEAVRADPAQFDLAVTDYYMPGMSGLEVAQALKEIRPDLPVVMASGYISEELRAKAPAVGIRELIYKPNTVEDLCEAVARFANAQGAEETSS